MRKYYFLFFIVILFVTCKKNDEVSDEVYIAEPFSQIRFNDPFEVYLCQDAVSSIKIVGAKENIKRINYKVEDNKLVVENNKKLKFLYPKNNKIKLYINYSTLIRIEVGEGCNIQTLNPIISDELRIALLGKSNQASLELNCNTVYFWNNFPCGGNISLYGNSDTLRVWSYAIMSVDAKKLITKTAFVENSSKGSCAVSVLDYFRYSIKGSGNIDLYTRPLEIIEDETTSSGRLVMH